MAKKYTEDQLNTLDKSFLVQMYLNLQEQLESLTKETHELNEKMQLMMNTLDKSFLVTGPFWPFLRKDDRCGSDLLQGSRWQHPLF